MGWNVRKSWTYWKVTKKGGKQKFSEWAPLVGKMFAHPVRVFWRYLEAPSSHIRNKSKNILEQKQFWEWAPLVGKMFAHPVGVFWGYLEAPSSHIRTKTKTSMFILILFKTPDKPPWRLICYINGWYLVYTPAGLRIVGFAELRIATDAPPADYTSFLWARVHGCTRCNGCDTSNGCRKHTGLSHPMSKNW